MAAAEETYRRLAQHLDQTPLGAPQGPELMAVLREMFSPDEAEIAAKLPFRPKRLISLCY